LEWANHAAFGSSQNLLRKFHQAKTYPTPLLRGEILIRPPEPKLPPWPAAKLYDLSKKGVSHL
jgi:hypothetical protein